MHKRPLAAAAALITTFSLVTPVRAEVLVYDEHDGHSGGTVGWAEDWPFPRANGELQQGAGYPRRRFNATIGAPNQILWIAVTGRMDSIIDSYSYHTPMGTTSWQSDYQYPGFHFANSYPNGFVTDDDSVSTGIAATTKQTWLARFELGPQLTDGSFNISIDIWAGPNRGETIDLGDPPLHFQLVEGGTIDSMYAGQSTAGNTFFIDREAVATTPEEALGLRRDIYIVAHQDDDTLFMNPDIATSIRSGIPLRTIYVTDGAAGEPEILPYREAGAMAAYAYMAGTGNIWTESTQVVAGKRLKVVTLNDRVSLTFLRLPADAGDQQFPLPSMQNSLAELYSFSGVTVTDTYQGDIWSREDVITVLNSLIASHGATYIGTQNGNLLHSPDHEEHFYGALFAMEARNRYDAPHVFHTYEGYSQRQRPENLSAEVTADKDAAFRWYAACDSHICGNPEDHCGLEIGCELDEGDDANYINDTHRMYRLNVESPGMMRFANRFRPSLCLGKLAGGELSLVPCMNVASQRFALTADHHLVSDSGGCVETSSDGTAVRVEPCASKNEQRWTVFEEGLILGTLGRCVEPVGGDQHATAIDAAIGCVGYDTQKWNVIHMP